VLEGEDAGLTLLELRERSGISAARFASVLQRMKREGTVIQVGKREGVPVYMKGVSDEAVL
jgi:DNA-binding IclR family transcriptional regulator